MDYFLLVNRIASECKKLFQRDKINISMNEALVLESIKRSEGRVKDLVSLLMKDRSYIIRLLREMEKKHLIERRDKVYHLTRTGIEENEKALKLCHDFTRKQLSISGIPL